jgi:hypothetical protein
MAGHELSHERQIGPQDGGDFSVASRRLTIDAQQGRSAVSRDLHGSREGPVGNDIRAMPVSDPRTAQENAHPITPIGYHIFATQESIDPLRREMIILRSHHHA